MTKLLVFDIDQTLVDSSRRENLSFFKDNLDLAHYQRQKYDRELGVTSDSLLPLGQVLENHNIYCDFVLVTAREFDFIDYNVLGKLLPNIMVNAQIVINRNNAHLFGGDKREQSSGTYKKPIFDWLKSYYNRELVIIDDCPKVLQVALENGHSAICARDMWHMTGGDIKGVLENALL